MAGLGIHHMTYSRPYADEICSHFQETRLLLADSRFPMRYVHGVCLRGGMNVFEWVLRCWLRLKI